MTKASLQHHHYSNARTVKGCPHCCMHDVGLACIYRASVYISLATTCVTAFCMCQVSAWALSDHVQLLRMLDMHHSIQADQTSGVGSECHRCWGHSLFKCQADSTGCENLLMASESIMPELQCAVPAFVGRELAEVVLVRSVVLL